ncbi:DUF916 domain-containing protein [Aeromicrobium sp.]|nr:DUF916 domain-containing protein [Candidatus Saccharibacteria bacterium]
MSRRRNVLTSLTVMLAAFVMLCGSTAPVFAADAVGGAGNGLRISPVSSNLTIKPGSNVTVDVYITNVTSQKTTFEVFVNDFVASGDESGNPALILDDGKSAPTHSLRAFVPKLSNVTLAPNEQRDIKVPISIPATAPAGGYFGAVRFAATTETVAGKNVALSASVASLILVKVPGNYKEIMSVESIDTRKKDKIHSIFTKKNDIDAVVRFKNSGDIQEVPFGKLTVTKMGGSVVYTTEVNNAETPGSVLPGSVRKFAIPLKSISSFGKYKIQGDFGYGKGQTLTANTTFYVIPVPIMIVLGVLIVLIIIAIVEVPRVLKRYNRRVLRRAGRGRK